MVDVRLIGMCGIVIVIGRDRVRVRVIVRVRGIVMVTCRSINSVRDSSRDMYIVIGVFAVSVIDMYIVRVIVCVPGRVYDIGSVIVMGIVCVSVMVIIIDNVLVLFRFVFVCAFVILLLAWLSLLLL